MSEEKNVNTEQTEEKPEKKERKNKKDEEIQKLKQELEAKQDLLLRTAAEFDNFKKRTERERISTAQYSKAMVIKEILPILDNADRALSADKDSPDFAKGVEMIVRQMSGLTEKLGVTEVAQVGDTFDPNFHNAVLHDEDETRGEGEIVDVFEKGYKKGDKIIRFAMVKTVN